MPIYATSGFSSIRYRNDEFAWTWLASIGTSPHAIGDLRLGGNVLAPGGWFGTLYANVVYDMNLELGYATPVFQRPALIET